MITGNGARISVPAVALAVLLGLTVARTAAASAFTDSCVAGGGGMFEAKDCACMESKAGADDQPRLTASSKPMPPARNRMKPRRRCRQGMALLNNISASA